MPVLDAELSCRSQLAQEADTAQLCSSQQLASVWVALAAVNVVHHCDGAWTLPTACRRPALPEDRLQLFKAQIADSIAHKNDSKNAIANRKVRQLMYGRESLYSREPSLQGLANITPQTAQEWLLARQRAPPSRRVHFCWRMMQKAAP
jgi:hypothetical protein